MKFLLLFILFTSVSFANESCLKGIALFINKSQVREFSTFKKFADNFKEQLSPEELTKSDFQFYKKNLDKPIYVNMKHLRPGQNRISYGQIQLRLNRFLKKDNATEFDRGNSKVKPESAVEAILSPWGIILLDGHHSFFTQIALGDTTFPVKISHDFSALTEEDFIEKLNKVGLLYLKSKSGRRVRPIKKFTDLEDDPWRFIIYNLTAKIYLGSEGIIERISSPSYKPLLMKVNDDHHPFMEFEMADELRKSFKGQEFELDFKDDFAEKYPEERKLMRELISSSESQINMKDWIVVPKGTNAKEIENEFVGKDLKRLKDEFK